MHRGFFEELEARIKVVETKPIFSLAESEGVGPFCFLNGKYNISICDGLKAGFVSINRETNYPTLQCFSRGLHFISKKDSFVLRYRDNYTMVTILDNGLRQETGLTFMAATGHGNNVGVVLHFWAPATKKWLREQNGVIFRNI